jgi:hypothetical protein
MHVYPRLQRKKALMNVEIDNDESTIMVPIAEPEEINIHIPTQ